VKDKYTLHKGSLKLTKKRKYKHPTGSKSEIVKPFVVPLQFCRVYYKEMQQKYEQRKAEKESKLSEIKTAAAQEEDLSSKIKMPGMPSAQKEEPKKPLIQVVRKKPTFCELYNKDATEFTLIVTVEKEESAKNIDVKVSESFIILQSEQ
jgi:predicted nuclease with TOPRIM domain